MANNFSELVPKIFKQALPRYRGRLTMPRYAYTDISPEEAEYGDTVNVRLPVETADEEDFQATFNPSLNDTEAYTAPVPLVYHKSASFNLTDKEVAEIEGGAGPVRSNAIVGAMDKLSRGMNKRGWELYKDVANYHEELDGSNNIKHPFDTNIEALNEVDRILFEQEIEEERGFVLNSRARYNLFNQPQFTDADKDPQNAQNFRKGRLGNKMGFRFDADTQAPRNHVTGTGVTGDPTVSGTHNKGATSVSIACDADDEVDVKDGDPIKIDGVNYTVAADENIGNSASGSIDLRQKLRSALTGGEAVEQVATESHSVNLAFGPYAFGLAVRAPKTPYGNTSGGLVIESQTVIDPITGIPMRMQILGGLGVTKVVFDILYGWGTLRPESAVRLAGKTF